MHRQHPELSLAQAHGVLAYYYDHKEEIDRELAEQDAELESYRAANPVSQVVERLRKLKQGRGALKASIEELSRDERIVVTLYYFEGLDVGEVAKTLQVTQDEVTAALERALVLLRERLHQADEVRSAP